MSAIGRVRELMDRGVAEADAIAAVAATATPHPGLMRCDDCGDETIARHLREGQWLCPGCAGLPVSPPVVRDTQLETLGQYTLAPDVWDGTEEAA